MRVLFQSNFPSEFCCCITSEPFSDPVCCADGFTYERSAITSWLRNHDTSPLTGSPLPSKALVPNLTLKKAIIEYCERFDVNIDDLFK